MLQKQNKNIQGNHNSFFLITGKIKGKKLELSKMKTNVTGLLSKGLCFPVLNGQHTEQ